MTNTLGNTEQIIKQLYQQNKPLIKNIVILTSLVCLLSGIFTNQFINIIIGCVMMYKTIMLNKSEETIEKHKLLLKLWVIVCFIFSFEYLVILQINGFWLSMLFNIIKIICCNGVDHLILMYDLYAEKIMDNIMMFSIYMETTEEIQNDTFNIVSFTKSKFNYYFGGKFNV